MEKNDLLGDWLLGRDLDRWVRRDFIMAMIDWCWRKGVWCGIQVEKEKEKWKNVKRDVYQSETLSTALPLLFFLLENGLGKARVYIHKAPAFSHILRSNLSPIQ